jgi:eukaryotic-like serine/threonine-protein kinase
MIDAGPESRARYQVITTLGQGGMARVLLTVSRGPAGVDKLLVVKELKAELKGDPEFLTMFLDEARIAARLNHPNVIQTYEVSSDGEHPLIVMEYLEGQSLSALLGRVGRKVMPLDLHLHILAQTAAGLHYAHELREFDGRLLDVVHRDVSPHNVFVTYDGLVKLVDFGIAKAADSAGLTRAGQFKGKVGYASAEQLGGGKGVVDRRTDIFALGVMIWEAVAGRRLTFGEAEGAVMNRRLHGDDPSIQSVVPDVPEDLARICAKAMAFDPADRYATAAELRAAIEGWLDASKRVGTEEIGALVRDHFAADREKIRGLVEARIRSLRAGDSMGPGDFSPLSRRIAPAAEPSEPTMRAASTASSVARPAPTPPAAERSRTPTLIAVGVALAVLATGFQLTRSGASGVADASPSAAPVASGHDPGTALATIDVSISADPPQARVLLDDVPLAGNPFHGAMPRSPLARRLRVTAPGFAPEERLVTLDRDLNLELALKPVPTSAPAVVGPSRIGPATVAPGKAAPTAAPGHAGGDPQTPGESLTNPTRKQPRTIDSAF